MAGAQPPRTASERGRPSPATAPAAVAREEPRWLAAGFFTLAASLLILSFDAQRALELRIQQAADARDWDEVLAIAARLRAYPTSTRLQVNRALYHTGQLCDRLFSYPQPRGADMLASLRDGLDVCLPLSDTLLELGHLNLAERYAHEALEILGERPAVLRRLACVHALQDRTEAARIFLQRLAIIPFQTSWARSQIHRLEQDPQCTNDTVLSTIRGVRVTTARADMEFDAPTLLKLAAESAGTNRMAFEYGVAQLLLQGSHDAVRSTLPRFRELGYRALPRHVEESMLLAGQGRDPRTLPSAGYAVRAETTDRFAGYLDALGRGSNQAALAAGFGDTVWFYDRAVGSHGARR